MTLGVSVIICCYNSETRLPETLRHLALQQVPLNVPWEIIVVDNASTDRTSLIANEEWAKFGSVKVSFNVADQSVPGLQFARERGISLAKYEFLLFCDDDNWLYPDYVSSVYEIMCADPLIGVLGGRGIIEAEQPALLSDEEMNKSTVNGPQTWAATEHWVYGAGSVYRKSVFIYLLNKGWEQVTTDRIGTKLISGGDVEICLMYYLCGYKIIGNDQLIFKHFVPHKRQNINYIIDLNFWLSYSNVLLNSYYSILNKDPRPFRQIVDQWFWGITKTLAKQKLLSFYKMIRTGKPLTKDEQLSLATNSGTFNALLKERKRITKHHLSIKKLLEKLLPDTDLHIQLH